MNLIRFRNPTIFPRCLHEIFVLTLLAAYAGLRAEAQEIALQVDPAQSTVKFTLGDVLHTVRGTFAVKPGVLHLEPATGKVSGEILVDAKTGQSGNGTRDRKMHKEILESDRYPEIGFRPTSVEESAASGKSSAKVHGTFSIHGVEREITVPAQVDIEPGHWTANVHFTVPYVKWGMKNPSTLFLRVNDTVEIDLAAAGIVTK
ncbi:MAG TPA: YceI family protein [Candidatus Sulfotelmatobacter sp.]